MVNGIRQRKKYTYSEIKDYMNCPLCYHIEHVEKKEVKKEYYKENKRVASDESVMIAISNYYYLHMEGRPPSLKQVYKKYYNEYSKKIGLSKDQNFLSDTVTTDSDRSITRNAYRWLRMFYEWNANTPQVVIAINHEFQIAYDEMIIEGTFPMIREVENEEGEREVELFIFGQLSKSSPEESLIRDTDATLLLKAFREAFGVSPNKLKAYAIERGKEYEVFRTEGDLNKLENTFLGFLQAVNSVTPYQRIGAHKDSGKFKIECDTYFDSKDTFD